MFKTPFHYIKLNGLEWAYKDQKIHSLPMTSYVTRRIRGVSPPPTFAS